jgi:glycosyltransferase involved in cell wall biosynthesis
LNVLVASTFVPFIRGGDSKIVSDLCAALRRRGHEVDTVLLPFHPDPDMIPEQLLALRLLDVSDKGDLLIAIRTPSYLLRHENKIVWFIHHHRPAYDLWGTTYQDVADTPSGLSLREPIIHADDLGLREATALFANSRVTARRLRDFNRLEAEVLYPPLTEGESATVGEYGDYVFCPSRISSIKRQALLVEAMASVRSGVRLILAGPPDTPGQLHAIERAVERLRVGDRVDVRGRWISEQEKRDLFASALACAYVPYDEDSYGYVTLEAYRARRPVITCTDSGGTLELVEDGRTGLVVGPNPHSLAKAMDTLFENRKRARELGEAGQERVGALGISWDRVIERLLA